MSNKLLGDFEELLDAEAKRVVEIIVQMYNEGKVVNKTYEELVRSIINKKFKYYNCDIMLRSYNFIPNDLEPDYKCIYPLAKRIEGTEKHLLRYAKWCKEDMKDKDHKKVAEDMALELIKYGEEHKNTRKTLAEIIANFMPDFFPVHHDSVDSRVVVLFLQNEINNNGYEVSSINPFRIVKL